MKSFPVRPFRGERWYLGVTCATCDEEIRTFTIDRSLFDDKILIRARHHGLFAETKIDGEGVDCRSATWVTVFPLAPRMLPPITVAPPPRRRGRLLAPEDASRTIVWNVGPISTQQEAPC